MSNAYYDTTRNKDTWLGIADLVFDNSNNVFISPPSDAIAQLTAKRPPDVQTAPGASSAFIVLRQLVIAREQDTRFFRLKRTGISQSFSVSVPIGGGSQTFQVVNSDAIGAIGFESFSAAIGSLSIGDVQVDSNTGTFVDVFLPNGNIGGVGVETLLTLVNQFGPYGYESNNPTSGGCRIKLAINNSSGAPQSFTMQGMGSQLTADQVLLDVHYTPPTGGPDYELVAGEPMDTGPIIIPLNLIIPVALMDPGSNNYGTLTLHPLVYQSYFSTGFFVKTLLYASLLYQLPGVS